MRILAALMAALLLPVSASAVTVSRLYNFQPGQKIQSSQLNGELNNIISAIDGNLDGTYNLSAGSVATANLATASVTISKLATLGQQISSSSLVSQRASSQEALVPNLTANITVDHRPVWVGLQADGASPGRVAYRHNGGGATDNSAFISFQRDVATANQAAIGARSITSSTDDIFQQLPCSAFWFIDTPSAGPHNYTAAFRIATSDNGILTVENCKLVVFEL